MALTSGQRTVLKAFKRLGELNDVELAGYVHHVADMSSSGIRTRRSELVRMGFLAETGTVTLRSGRSAWVYGITSAGKQALRARKRSAVAA